MTLLLLLWLLLEVLHMSLVLPCIPIWLKLGLAVPLIVGLLWTVRVLNEARLHVRGKRLWLAPILLVWRDL